MAWEPISRAELERDLTTGCSDLSANLSSLWDQIRIEPEKWQCPPWGDRGGGFWVVAMLENLAIWYNDIEEGYNISEYSNWGTLDQYFCDKQEIQDSLYIASRIVKGGSLPAQPGPPEPIE